MFNDLLEKHGEENGGTESFFAIEPGLIGCRYGDCCIRLEADGWRYGKNVQAHSTPSEAYRLRGSDLIQQLSNA